MTGVTKWILDDGTTTVKFAYNPSTMTTPFPPKDIQAGGMNADGSFPTIMNPTKAAEWTLTGNLYSDAEYTKLETWHEKDQVLILTDHLGRAWTVVSMDLNIVERQATRNNAHRYTYTWKLLNLGEA